MFETDAFIEGFEATIPWNMFSSIRRWTHSRTPCPQWNMVGGSIVLLSLFPQMQFFYFFFFFLSRWIQFWKRPNGSSVSNKNIQVSPGKPIIRQWVIDIYASRENDWKLFSALPELRTTEKESFEWQSGCILCLKILVEKTAECCISRIQNVFKMLDFSLPGEKQFNFWWGLYRCPCIQWWCVFLKLNCYN